MRKLLFIVLAAALVAGAAAGNTGASSGWEAGITASVLGATNKLFIGQNTGATDGFDGYFDVPALLSGGIKAYFDIQGTEYWRDIKSTDGARKVWLMKVSSELRGEKVVIKWDPARIPSDRSVILVDRATGQVVDMNRSAGYTYINNEDRVFEIWVG